MFWEGKNILITGVNGFVGSYMAEKLINEGSNVYGLVRKKADGRKAKNLVDRGIAEKVNLLDGDLIDITSVANALDKSNAEYIFHLAAQSYVPRFFENPIETQTTNCNGTSNLLEAVRIKNFDSKIIFAGTSEEYGLVISSHEQYERAKKGYGIIFPEPKEIPELPISETNPLRPMSPYAVSKVYGDFLMRNYYHSYGLDAIVSRAFNHEGAGRGLMFVSSVISSQIMKLKLNEIDKITIGNVNALRDWSHVKDIINGYLLLAEKGSSGEVYNQGSMRTNSVLTFILLGIEQAGWEIEEIETENKTKKVQNPTMMLDDELFGVKFPHTIVDHMIMNGEIEYKLEDKGIIVHTTQGAIKIKFNPERFRPAEVPILLADTKKIQKLGAKIDYSFQDIVRDQFNYFIEKENRF